MSTEKAKTMIEKLLVAAGIHINGKNPWDLQVYNDRFFKNALQGGSLRIGEAYVAKWWDCLNLDEFYNRVLRLPTEEYVQRNWNELFEIALNKVFNFQTLTKALDVSKKHYDLGNFLFENMLDKRMVYTCAYWKDAATLDEAQEKKLDLTCLKLNLQPGMHVLDIGCGWGSFS
jgi:cyclopropane-fatty-acyl-phospholipid synthase